MPGRRFSEGLHQAIEAKEGVTIQNESKTMASITFQNYFRMYNKLAGMTGTAKTEEEEFRNIYNMTVTQIPTNKPVQRVDKSDLIYISQKGKFDAVVEDVVDKHKKDNLFYLVQLQLKRQNIFLIYLKTWYQTWCIKRENHEREAEIVANAGQKALLQLQQTWQVVVLISNLAMA